MGNRHLRRDSPLRPPKGNGKAARHSRSVAVAPAQPEAAKIATVAGVAITPEECENLAQDLAYFNVCIYREAAPGDIRNDDIERAQQDIIAAARRTS